MSRKSFFVFSTAMLSVLTYQQASAQQLNVQVTATPDPMYVRRDQYSTAWVHLSASSPLNAQLAFELKRKDIYGLCSISAGLSASSFTPPTLQGSGTSRFDYIAPFNVGAHCIKFWALIDDQPDQSSIFYLMEVSDAPEVTTIHPVEVQDDSAVLRGVVDCRYADTSVWLEWGTSTAYGWATTPATVSKYDTGGVAYDRLVTGLSPATQYHYRLVAENCWGRVYGGNQTFVTAAGVPVATTSSAGLLTGTTAELNGSANPSGASTTAWFRYATTNPGTCNDTFGTRAPIAGGVSLGAGASPVSYSEPISGLVAGTPYYYCAIAQNAEGTGFGSVVSFTLDDPPAVDSTSPANDATNVAVDSDITITFTEDVTVVSWFAISCSSSGTHTAAESGGPLTYTLNPDIDFVSGELCTVTIYVEGVSDNDTFDPPDNMAGDYVFSFTTQTDLMFNNGFESGDTTQWSASIP